MKPQPPPPATQGDLGGVKKVYAGEASTKLRSYQIKGKQTTTKTHETETNTMKNKQRERQALTSTTQYSREANESRGERIERRTDREANESRGK